MPPPVSSKHETRVWAWCTAGPGCWEAIPGCTVLPLIAFNLSTTTGQIIKGRRKRGLKPKPNKNKSQDAQVVSELPGSFEALGGVSLCCSSENAICKSPTTWKIMLPCDPNRQGHITGDGPSSCTRVRMLIKEEIAEYMYPCLTNRFHFLQWRECKFGRNTRKRTTDSNTDQKEVVLHTGHNMS